jgi:hypothetical protein
MERAHRKTSSQLTIRPAQIKRLQTLMPSGEKNFAAKLCRKFAIVHQQLR